MSVTLQDILQTAFAAWASNRELPVRVRRAASALRRCRTEALGGQVRACPEGHVTQTWYNSCGHRACPQCWWRRTAEWLEAWKPRLLPTVHFHVIFTLPSQLHVLWQWNRAVFAALLFRCVRETLFTLLADPQFLGAQPGILAALHTWGATLMLHPHIHCLVTGGGLAADGLWRAVTTGYLLPVRVVRVVFRGKLLSGLEALWQAGQLRLPPGVDDDGMRQLLIAAARQKWNVRINPGYAHGRGVATYLARYLRGGPLKNSRLVSFDGERVAFRYRNYRATDAHGQPRQATLILPVAEFLRRWSEHVPLPAVHSLRAWGLYASRQRRALELCRAQLPPAPALPEATVPPPPPHDAPWEHCPICGKSLVILHVLPRAGAPPLPTTHRDAA
jgi:hypothetical protein